MEIQISIYIGDQHGHTSKGPTPMGPIFDGLWAVIEQAHYGRQLLGNISINININININWNTNINKNININTNLNIYINMDINGNTNINLYRRSAWPHIEGTHTDGPHLRRSLSNNWTGPLWPAITLKFKYQY